MDQKVCLSSSVLPVPRFRYSPIVKTGPFYTFAGMVARAPGSTDIVSGGPGEELRFIFKTLRSALAEHSLTVEDMTKCTIFTTQLSKMEELTRAWDEVFQPGMSFPARTTIGVAELPLKATVEAEFQFYKP